MLGRRHGRWRARDGVAGQVRGELEEIADRAGTLVAGLMRLGPAGLAATAAIGAVRLGLKVILEKAAKAEKYYRGASRPSCSVETGRYGHNRDGAAQCRLLQQQEDADVTRRRIERAHESHEQQRPKPSDGGGPNTGSVSTAERERLAHRGFVRSALRPAEILQQRVAVVIYTGFAISSSRHG